MREHTLADEAGEATEENAGGDEEGAAAVAWAR